MKQWLKIIFSDNSEILWNFPIGLYILIYVLIEQCNLVVSYIYIHIQNDAISNYSISALKVKGIKHRDLDFKQIISISQVLLFHV